jgi:hypothetical protein
MEPEQALAEIKRLTAEVARLKHEEARCHYALAEQMRVIDKLDAEIQRLNEVITNEHDALMCLQNIFSDPEVSASLRARAAAAAVGYQYPKLSVVAGFHDTNWGDQLHEARMRAFPPKVIEHEPDPAA